MTALSKDFLNTKVEPAQVVPNLFPNGLPVAAATKIYANSIVAMNASGYAVPASATSSLVVIGRAINSADNSGGAAGDLEINIEQGAFDFAMASGVNALVDSDIGKVVYAQDDCTISKTDQGGTLPIAGVFLGLYTPSNNSTTRAIVQFGPSILAGMVGADSFKSYTARAVITSLAAYAAASGVLTASANGAIGAQDGVTLAVGDLVILPAYTAGAATIAAADVGPYVVTAVGSASAKFVLSRPAWWASSAAIPVGKAIEVGGEGTVWSGSTWKALSGAGVVDTADPKLYPAVVKGTKTLSGGAGTVSNLFVWTAAQAACTDTTAAAAVKAVLTAGNGTGSIALTGTTTDVIGYVITNF
jgi:hypothetical protein